MVAAAQHGMRSVLPAASGTILYPPSREDCDVGLLFIEVSGCLPMCGHGTIGTVTAVLEEGLVVPREPGRLAIEAPSGRVAVEYSWNGQYVDQVKLFNVASAADVELEIPGLGTLNVDLSFGGNYYVIIESQSNWIGLDDMPSSEIVRLSPIVRKLAELKLVPVHPQDDRIRGVSHVMWCDKPRDPGTCSKRRFLRRKSDRPISLRHGIVRAYGATRRKRSPRRRANFRSRAHYRHKF